MEKRYNCTTIDEIAEKIEETRLDLLFQFEDAGMAPIAEQHYLAAIANLDQAVRSFKLSHLHQMKGE